MTLSDNPEPFKLSYLIRIPSMEIMAKLVNVKSPAMFKSKTNYTFSYLGCSNSDNSSSSSKVYTSIIIIYRVIECLGPTNTRVYTVGVYFRGQRLAAARGHSIQEAEMNAAEKALSCAHGMYNRNSEKKTLIKSLAFY